MHMMKVGMLFALLPLLEEPGSVNLKCDQHSASLREVYHRSRPGYTRASGTGTPLTPKDRSRTTSYAA
jgi:hypothetical protein